MLSSQRVQPAYTTTYRCKVTASDHDWSKLAAEAARVKTTGNSLVSEAVRQFCAHLPEPPPLPEGEGAPYDGEDAGELGWQE